MLIAVRSEGSGSSPVDADRKKNSLKAWRMKKRSKTMGCLVSRNKIDIQDNNRPLVNDAHINPATLERVRDPFLNTEIVVSPSGKAWDFDSPIRWFDSSHHSHSRTSYIRDYKYPGAICAAPGSYPLFGLLAYMVKAVD